MIDTPERPSPPRAKRHWLRFRLRTLFLLVAVIAIALGVWTQRKRWYVARLANPETAQAAFEKIIELHAETLPPEVRDNVIARRQALREMPNRRFAAWPQKPGSFWPGYVWVLEEGALYAVSPEGETNLGAIAVPGPEPQVLWSGTLPDGRPGIVVFNQVLGPDGNDGYLFCISTRRVSEPVATEMPFVRLAMRIRHPDVTAELLAGTENPTIVLKSADGKHVDEFAFRYGPAEPSANDLANTVKTYGGPWEMRWER